MVVVTLLWSVLALWIDGPANRVLAGLLSVGLMLVAIALLVLTLRWRWVLAVTLVPFAAVLVWWLSISPSNDRNWQPDVARPATAEIRGNQVTIHNVRNFSYPSPTSSVERWETRTYDLGRLQSLDLFVSYWGPRAYAHTIVSWTFEGSAPLAISIETRKEKGEDYSALLGFFRQYELYYVVADERDVIGVRAGPRGEQVFLYRLGASPELARKILLDYLKEINRLARKPRWYNALTHNCTTTIRHHAQQVGAGNPFDWRILANGYLDEMAYERSMINTHLPFPLMRERSEITVRARAALARPEFSELIRVGLPERP